MSRLFSFFLSAAIIVLCLWLNVSSYPNVLRQESANASDKAEEVEVAEASNNLQQLDEQKDEKTQSEPSRSKEDVKSDSATDVKNAPVKSEKNEKESISAGVENNLLNVSVASNQQFSSSEKDEKSSNSSASEVASNAQANADKPQGGKYVSIPSVEVDAFRSRFSSDSGRVVGVARASVVAE